MVPAAAVAVAAVFLSSVCLSVVPGWACDGCSTMGAYSASHIYSPSDIAALVQYATYRGVRIIPEFDSPSHVMPSWGKGGPSELLTTCGKSLGPLRADREQVLMCPSYHETFLLAASCSCHCGVPFDKFHEITVVCSVLCCARCSDVRPAGAWERPTRFFQSYCVR